MPKATIITTRGQAALLMGQAVEDMTSALSTYVEAHRAAYGSPVAEDGVIGDDGVRPMLDALLTLLNGELGKHDGATLDRAIRDVAEASGWTRDVTDT